MFSAMERPLMGAPGQQNMNQRKFWEGDTSNPYKVLEQVESVAIQEKVKGMEMLTGFETGNKYAIKDLRTGCELFLAMETSDGLMGALGRNAMQGGSRPFNLKVGMLTGEDTPPERFAMLERPFKCTCCCFQRPSTTFKDSRTGEVMGGILEPFTPCKFTYVLFDRNEEHYGEVDEWCCKTCCFGCPCNQVMEFPIKRKSGEMLATISKHFTAMNAIGAVTGIAADADYFTVAFEPGMSAQEKMHAISTALFMDFCLFTKGGSEQRDGSGASAIGGAFGGEEGEGIGQLIGFAVGAAAAMHESSQEKQKGMDW